MNPKILVAFVAGGLLASGIVYLAVRPEATVKSSAQPLVVEPAGPPAAVSEPATPAPVSFPDTPARPTKTARTAKPSPMPARQQRQVVAQTMPPSSVPQQMPEVRQPDPAPPVATPAPPPALPAPAPEPVQPHSVTVTAGTTLQIRIGETLTTQKNQPGDTFLATLAQPLVVDGFVIAERGARAEGRVVEVDRGGKVKGVSRLTVELTRLTTADGQHVRIRTASYNKDGQSGVKKDAAKVGGGAALGAIIGAIAGGGKGAGIGAGVGGAAGAGDVLLTRGPDAVIPVETRLSFRVEEPVTITEKLR
jgi:hypothetical protein